MTAIESQLRREICEVARLSYELGFCSGTSGNISALIPNDNEDFGGDLLITPSGVPKRLLTPEAIIKTNKDGVPREDNSQRGAPSVEFKLHLACYRERKDVKAVVHMHPPIATGFALAGKDFESVLKEISNLNPPPEIALYLGKAFIAPYAPVGSAELSESVIPFIRENNAVLLESHGALTVGKDLFEASRAMETLEYCAKVILTAKQLIL